MAMLRTQNQMDSRKESDALNSSASFKTWQQIWDVLEIRPIKLAWNADGATMLAALRKNYGAHFMALKTSELDEVVMKYRHHNIAEQAKALGSALQLFDLTLGKLNIDDGDNFQWFIANAKDLKNRTDALPEDLTRRLNHRVYSILKLGYDINLETQVDDIKVPVDTIQVLKIYEKKFNNYLQNEEYFQLDHFFIVKKNHITSHIDQNLRIYDLRYWPLRELKYELAFDRGNIEPYTLIIESECGEKFCYIGTEINELELQKVRMNEFGEYFFIPKDKNRFAAYHRQNLVQIGAVDVKEIPSLSDARPVMLIDNRVIYYYLLPDVSARLSNNGDENISSTMEKYRRFNLQHKNILLEYSSETQKFRKIKLDNYPYPMNQIVYKNTWMVLVSWNRMPNKASYILRLWNPRTNECLRLSSKDMGGHVVEEVFSTAGGDILLLLDDGRICRFNVDLVSWLKEDMQQHGIELDPWQDEIRRAYENFPVMTRRAQVHSEHIDDRMLITFEDGKTYDIVIRGNRELI